MLIYKPTGYLMAEKTITLTLLNRQYQFRCDEEDVTALQHAAEQVNAESEKLKNTRHITNIEQRAVMTALNSAFELHKTIASNLTTNKENLMPALGEKSVRQGHEYDSSDSNIILNIEQLSNKVDEIIENSSMGKPQ